MANKYTTFCTRSVLLFYLVLTNNGNLYTHGLLSDEYVDVVRDMIQVQVRYLEHAIKVVVCSL